MCAHAPLSTVCTVLMPRPPPVRTGNRHLTVEDDTEDEDGEDGGGGSSTPATGAAEAAEAPGGGGEGGGGGGRSQPVRMQVRSSGKAAVRDMALSFAMSFTNDRGVRKKVGFQYGKKQAHQVRAARLSAHPLYLSL